MKRKIYQVFALLIASVSMMLAAPAHADIRQFTPRIYDYSAELELNIDYQYTENTSDGRGLTTKDFFSREKLNFYLTGYSYHPRFIQYSLKLSTGLKQENYENDYVSSGWNSGTSFEYNVRAILLPEHPYNLEVFASRLEPLVPHALSEQSSTVTYSKGAFFRYKLKPFFANMSYVDNSTETDQATYDSTAYHASGAYYKEYVGGDVLSITGAYDRRESSSGVSSFDATSESYSLANSIVLRNASLGSALVWVKVDQGGGFTLKNELFSWTENLGLTLPWNFSTNLGYTYAKDKSTTATAISPEEEITTDINAFRFQLNHKLYASLSSNYTFGYEKRESPRGEGKVNSNAFNVNYVKNIPRGRMRLNAGYSRTKTENIGNSVVANEPHNGVDVPGFFEINASDVDLSQPFVVYVETATGPRQLTENFNYTLTVLPTKIRVDIINLFNLLPDNISLPFGTYNFLVSYALSTTSTELETTSYFFGASANLYNDMVNPYYLHYNTKQTQLSGTFLGDNFDETSDTIGINLSRAPYTFMAEYQNVDSNISPYTKWRTELRYLKDITYTASLQAKVRYESTDYPSGTGGSGQSYTDRIAGFDVGLQKRFPKRNMTLSVIGAYYKRKALQDSDQYSLSSFFNWSLKKLNVNAGATVNRSTTTFESSSSERTDMYFYLNVKRTLF
jgi:hypothetical protein